MSAASGEFFSSDGSPALPAWLTAALIHPGLTSIVAVHSLKVPEVAEGGSTCSDADGEDLHQGVPQAVELGQAQATCGC